MEKERIEMQKQEQERIEKEKQDRSDDEQDGMNISPIISTNASADDILKRIWVQSVATKKWRECAILEETDTQYRVHYISYHPKYDELIEKKK